MVLVRWQAGLVTRVHYRGFSVMTILQLTGLGFSPIVEKRMEVPNGASFLRSGTVVALIDLLPREVAGRQQTHIAMDRW